MKPLLLISIISIFSINTASAQKTEFGLQLNSGLFSFSGKSAMLNTEIAYDNYSNSYYLGASFGKHHDLNMGLGVNIKWISSKSGIFLSANLGLEQAKSRVDIRQLHTNNTIIDAKGKVNLRLSSIYFAPTVGYRFSISKDVKLDLGIGMDLSYLIYSDKKMKIATLENNQSNVQVGREYFHKNSDVKYDLRPHVNSMLKYKAYGVFCGYSLGTTNYLKGMMGGGPWYATSNLWRFGFNYQLN